MIVVHRCRRCGHNNLEHGATTCSENYCAQGCGNDRADFAPPEIIPTWDALTRRPVMTITQPGGVWNRKRMCACDDCRALYMEATA